MPLSPIGVSEALGFPVVRPWVLRCNLLVRYVADQWTDVVKVRWNDWFWRSQRQGQGHYKVRCNDSRMGWRILTKEHTNLGIWYDQKQLHNKTDTDRNIDRLRDFLRTHQLNIAIFIVVDLKTSHMPLKLAIFISHHSKHIISLLPRQYYCWCYNNYYYCRLFAQPTYFSGTTVRQPMTRYTAINKIK